MSLQRGLEAHPGTSWVWREPDARWPLATCSFCGSISPETAEQLLNAEFPHASGSDWKYGWPHKFYVYDTDGKMWKFYSEHLTTAENFETLAERIDALLHISFAFDDQGRLSYMAPAYGYQTWVRNGVEGA